MESFTRKALLVILALFLMRNYDLDRKVGSWFICENFSCEAANLQKKITAENTDNDLSMGRLHSLYQKRERLIS